MAKFDLEKTAMLDRLFQVPHEQRGAAWLAEFYAAAPDASLATGEQQLIQGPDGFPYFALYLPKADQPFDSFCISHVVDACLKHGTGVVINPDKSPPDWVFGYGHLWSLHSYGTFDKTPQQPEPRESLAAGRQVLMASPSEQFLPGFARHVLKAYFARFGVNNPRVLLINDARSAPSQSLAFSFYREDVESDEAFNDVMTRIKSWFLPPHYGLVALPKASEYDSYFAPL